MKKISKFMLNKSLFIFMFLNLSCAIVTINVYFPAEEVKDVFQSLEDELLENTEGNTDGEPTDTDSENSVEAEPTSSVYPKYPTVSETKIIATKRVIRLVPEAYAQSNVTQKILREIKSDPDVQKAYDRRNGRLSTINLVLSKRLAGEGNQGLIVPKGTLSAGDTKAVNDENADRKIIIQGMAKAIIKINKLEMTADNINSVKPQAAEQFAAVRRDEVKSGTLIQLTNGQWSAK